MPELPNTKSPEKRENVYPEFTSKSPSTSVLQFQKSSTSAKQVSHFSSSFTDKEITPKKLYMCVRLEMQYSSGIKKF